MKRSIFLLNEISYKLFYNLSQLSHGLMRDSLKIEEWRWVRILFIFLSRSAGKLIPYHLIS